MAANRHPANDAWEALLSAHAALMKEFAAEDIWGDLSMREYDVLYTLSKCPELRIGELNRHVLLSQPALSRLVDRLAERGLLERKPDPAIVCFQLSIGALRQAEGDRPDYGRTPPTQSAQRG